MRHGQHDIQLTQLKEAKGNMTFYHQVSFEGEGVSFTSTDDPDGGVNLGDVVPQGMRPRTSSAIGAPKPSIRNQADAEGSVSNKNNDNRRKFRPFKFLGIQR